MNFLTPVPDMIPFDARPPEWLSELRERRRLALEKPKKPRSKRVKKDAITKMLEAMSPEQRKAAGF